MTEKPIPALRIGTCSWKYDSWKGLVYSDTNPANMLAEYSARYSTVEVDQWFWSLFERRNPVLPRKEDAEKYAAAVSKDFRFSVKVPNSLTLTHYYQKLKSDPLAPNPHFLSVELFSAFIESLKPMHDNLGPVIFQFEYLNKLKMSSAAELLERFGKFLDKLPGGFEYALETRNPNFLNKEFFEFISARRIIPVFLQGYYMPPVFDIIGKYARFLPGTVVIRLHGPDRGGIENKTKKIWDKIVEPKDEELAKLVQMLLFLKARGVDVYVNVNNHYEGSAPLTISKIVELLADSKTFNDQPE